MAQPTPPHGFASLRHMRLPLLAAFFLLISGLGLLSVYHLFAGQQLSFDTRLLKPGPLLGMTALILLYFCADGLRLYHTLRALGYQVPLPLMARLVFINLFFSNITPLATGGGLVQIWYLRRAGVPLSRGSAATSIRTLLALALIFVGAPLYLLLEPRLDGLRLLGDFALPLAVFVSLYLLALALVILRSRWLVLPLSALISALHRRHLITAPRHRVWQYRLRRGLLRFSQSFRDYLRGDRWQVALSLFWTVVFLLSLLSIPALLIAALGYELPYLSSVGRALLTTFIMYFAPTPGASGISEGVFAGLFQSLLSPHHLILVVVSWRFLSIYLGMLLGLLLMQMELGRRHKAHSRAPA